LGYFRLLQRNIKDNNQPFYSVFSSYRGYPLAKFSFTLACNCFSVYIHTLTSQRQGVVAAGQPARRMETWKLSPKGRGEALEIRQTIYIGLCFLSADYPVPATLFLLKFPSRIIAAFFVFRVCKSGRSVYEQD
jgi:hypothetical protein